MYLITKVCEIIIKINKKTISYLGNCRCLVSENGNGAKAAIANTATLALNTALLSIGSAFIAWGLDKIISGIDNYIHAEENAKKKTAELAEQAVENINTLLCSFYNDYRRVLLYTLKYKERR